MVDGMNPEVVGKCHSGRQDLFQLEDSLFGIVGVLVAAPFRCFDDDLDHARIILITRR